MEEGTAAEPAAVQLAGRVAAVVALLSVLGLFPGPSTWVGPSSLHAQDDTIRQWRYVPGPDGPECDLELATLPRPVASAGEIVVRIHAASLNGRDRYQLQGCGGPVGASSDGDEAARVPLSDGAGEVVAVGPGATRFEVGDRVVGTFFAEAWNDGDRPQGAMPFRRGGPGQGMLSEMVVGHEDGFVPVPENLSYVEASTLTTAGVTAFNGLFKYGDLQPGEYVLLEGTGGVSSFGLLFSVAAGARPIITSSSDEKLARARELGAVGTVNYRQNPEWQEDVLRLTDGAGVKHVLEIGGRETTPRALEALGLGGHIALIGGLTGFGGEIPFGALFDKDASATGFHVGSRADFEAMNAFIEGHDIHPIVDRVFDFEDAPEAFDFYNNGDFMGKVVIRVGDDSM